jgi:predicted 3-demethylubiquinone-9 3-methyltransferase (glyoxalase superfamily)
MQKTTTFLMFVGDQCGKAEEAMNLYTSLFDDSEIRQIIRFEKGEPGGEEGLVKQAFFTLQGQEYIANDSPAPHPFTFTPAISIFVDCESEEEQTKLHGELVQGGQELMPMDDYGFSKRFAWVSDRFGVSWQLNLAGWFPAGPDAVALA